MAKIIDSAWGLPNVNATDLAFGGTILSPNLGGIVSANHRTFAYEGSTASLTFQIDGLVVGASYRFLTQQGSTSSEADDTTITLTKIDKNYDGYRILSVQVYGEQFEVRAIARRLNDNLVVATETGSQPALGWLTVDIALPNFAPHRISVEVRRQGASGAGVVFLAQIRERIFVTGEL